MKSLYGWAQAGLLSTDFVEILSWTPDAVLFRGPQILPRREIGAPMPSCEVDFLKCLSSGPRQGDFQHKRSGADIGGMNLIRLEQ